MMMTAVTTPMTKHRNTLASMPEAMLGLAGTMDGSGEVMVPLAVADGYEPEMPVPVPVAPTAPARLLLPGTPP